MSGVGSEHFGAHVATFLPGGEDEATLVDVLDRLLDRGVVVSGELRVSVADVDLLFVGVRLFLSSVDAIEDARDRRDAATVRPEFGRADVKKRKEVA